MRLRLSILAREDIAFIHDYTVEQWGGLQAERYVDGLWDALEEIVTAPERWRLRPDIFPGCRARVYANHLIIFRVRDGQVEISRVLHGAMNLPAHVPPEFMEE